MGITQVAGSIQKERILIISNKMDWVIVNYYREGETFTVIESEKQERVRWKWKIMPYLPLIVQILRFL